MPSRGDPARVDGAATPPAAPGAKAATPGTVTAGRRNAARHALVQQVRAFRLPLFCLGLATVFGALTVDDLLAGRQQLWRRTTETARQLSLLISQDIDHAVTRLDRALRHAAERQAAPELAAMPPALRQAFLFDQALAEEDVRLVFLLDARGDIISASGALPPGQTGMGYLRSHGRHGWGGLWFSPPQPGPEAREVVALSRGLHPADDRFAGAVVALLDLDSLRRRLEAHLQVADGGFTLGLYRHDGVALLGAAWPGPAAGQEAGIASIFRQAALQPNGFVTSGTAQDGRLLHGFAWVGGWPLLVSVSGSAAEMEAEWRARAIVTGLTTLGLLGALLTPILLLQREVMRRHAAEQEARRNSDEFRLLAENSGDMVSRIGPDRIRRYVSPASRRILGREPEELIGRSPREITHPDDKQQMLDTVGPVYAGEVEEATTAYRICRDDGTWVWLEARVRSVRDPATGLPDGIVAIARDVTERKRLEAEIAQLVTEDPLTGLANRRAFDAGFERELHRCAGLRQPVAILLIDVDHFKLFNDHYGHPRGDACLRRVAAVIGTAAAHPVDLAARYGGEEFILLLPGASLAEAERRAEGLREAVEALAIPHLGAGGRHQVVTVSIGLAASVPEPGDVVLAAELLVQQADHCLYEAKRRGRNCVIAAGSAGVVA